MKLRGHHLVCLHYFHGEGYAPAFIENLEKLISLAEAGEEIQVAYGADDVCRACPYLSNDQCAHKEGAEKEVQTLDKTARTFLGVDVDDRVFWQQIKSRVWPAPEDWFASFCKGCDWLHLCDKIRLQNQD